MAELVALSMPGGPELLDALQRIWAAGDAVLPLDPRAPASYTDRIMRTLVPGAVVEADGERRALPDGIPVEAGDAVVIATSGTTGAPKGAVHTHAAVMAAARITAAACDGAGPAARWLACLPLVHVGGFSVITRAVHTGAALEIHDGLDPVAVDRSARLGATHVSLVPAALGRIDPRPWRAILLGGSAIPADRPPNSIATYGMTETFGGVVYDGLPLLGVSVRVGPGEQLEIHSPTLLRAYRSGRPEGTDPRTPDGWFRTGDLGAIGPDGRITVAGRADDLIITGGAKVWPTAVEEVLVTHPLVEQVAVVGRSDPDWGQRVVAHVVPADPIRPPTLDALRGWVKARLPVAAAPKELVIVDVLPRTALGKLARHDLTDEKAGSSGAS